MKSEAKRLFAPRAWIGGAWQSDVLLGVDAQGLWSSMEAGASSAARRDAESLNGPVLPGIVDAHSHAFQRAMAGQAERMGAGGARDDFWSWRDAMYRVANRIAPDELEAIATQLYRELLAGGYTHVCEFHYLHNDADGKRYAQPAEMALALVRAARATGIGLTVLPTLYMHQGFGKPGLREDQRRFASTPDSVLRIAEAVRAEASDGGTINAGIALHSLRAVDAGALREVEQALRGNGWPIHIHVAEQQQEVDDCVAATGKRPIEWLLENASVDARWNLVHATQATPAELAAIRASGASVVLCPTTEANLGDGVFDLPSYAGGRWSIGSDSNVCRDWAEELRLLEYSQRLVRRERNVAARVAGVDSSGAALFQGALEGGGAATSLPVGGIEVGKRAHFCVVEAAVPAPGLRSRSIRATEEEFVLDELVFAPGANRIVETWAAGKRVS